MKNFQEKRGFKYLIQTKPFLIFLAIVIIFFTFNIVKLVGKMNETVKNRKIAEEKVIELQQRKQKLLGDIKKLETDKGKEEIFRENFGLSKEGEGMIMVVEDKNQKKPEEEKSENSIFSFFKNLFK